MLKGCHIPPSCRRRREWHAPHTPPEVFHFPYFSVKRTVLPYLVLVSLVTGIQGLSLRTVSVTTGGCTESLSRKAGLTRSIEIVDLYELHP
ncbi:hypothetical protein TNCT_425071 [Trichonephila clavata]|uniref:Uncharacterized protein n=1 Tax=Trichonephila clavata TaxID=2740835 RepID=A0A8X6LW06_TRICU|nr:hypothetical protein TNCT_425071 [Trichonephila clavata]